MFISMFKMTDSSTVYIVMVMYTERIGCSESHSPPIKLNCSLYVIVFPFYVIQSCRIWLMSQLTPWKYELSRVNRVRKCQARGQQRGPSKVIVLYCMSNLSIYKETDIIILYFSIIQETNSCSNCRNSASYNSSPLPENA